MKREFGENVGFKVARIDSYCAVNILCNANALTTYYFATICIKNNSFSFYYRLSFKYLRTY